MFGILQTQGMVTVRLVNINLSSSPELEEVLEDMILEGYFEEFTLEELMEWYDMEDILKLKDILERIEFINEEASNAVRKGKIDNIYPDKMLTFEYLIKIFDKAAKELLEKLATTV